MDQDLHFKIMLSNQISEVVNRSFKSLIYWSCLRSVTLIPQSDKWGWNLDPSYDFLVKLARRHINDQRISVDGQSIRWKTNYF